jgi:hypothetical protein
MGLAAVRVGIAMSSLASSALAIRVSMSGQACMASAYGGDGRSSGVLAPTVDGDVVTGGGSRSRSTMGEKELWWPSLSDSSESSES